MKHFYSEEENQFIIDNVKGRSLQELTRMFNEKFNTNISESRIQGRKSKLKVTSDYCPTLFKKGRTPHNKGVPMTKEQYEKAKATMFKKGHISGVCYNVGDEVVNANGYVDVKIAQPNVWKSKARLIYEKEYGELDDSKQVIFADGNNRNFEIDNLIAVTKAEMLIMNQRRLYKKNKELTRAGANVAKLIHKIYKREE